jgi:hypothetical protein
MANLSSGKRASPSPRLVTAMTGLVTVATKMMISFTSPFQAALKTRSISTQTGQLGASMTSRDQLRVSVTNSSRDCDHALSYGCQWAVFAFITRRFVPGLAC